MNIFVLHSNPKKAARWHADKHVVKMILESVQMLYTAHWIVAYPFLLDCKAPIHVAKAQRPLPTPPALRMWKAPFQLKQPDQRGYRPVHVHHPCTVWVRSSLPNYLWLCRLTIALVEEHQFRWPESIEHSCGAHARWLLDHPPALPSLGQTPFALAMPEDYKKGHDAIRSYRAFYKGSKTERGITNRYTKRHRPHWLL